MAPVVKNPLGKLHVMIVDDDKLMVDLIHGVLENFGFKHIVTATSGDAALQTMLNSSRVFDMIISDWEMEPMSGIDLVKHLRKDPTSPNRFIPIIMLTGRAEKHNVEAARDTGITEFLAKPFTVKALRQRIISIIDHPRDFVLAEEYIGPDRRRKQIDREGKEDRRQS